MTSWNNTQVYTEYNSLIDMEMYGRIFFPIGIILIVIGIGCFIALGITQHITSDSLAFSAFIGGILSLSYMIYRLTHIFSIYGFTHVILVSLVILVIFGIVLGIWAIKQRIEYHQVIVSSSIAVYIIWSITLLIYMYNTWKINTKQLSPYKWS